MYQLNDYNIRCTINTIFQNLIEKLLAHLTTTLPRIFTVDLQISKAINFSTVSTQNMKYKTIFHVFVEAINVVLTRILRLNHRL